jgi:hypothetical protein
MPNDSYLLLIEICEVEAKLPIECYRKNCSSRLSRDYGEFFSEITSQDWEGNGNTGGREILFWEPEKQF